MRTRLIDQIRLYCGMHWQRRTPMMHEIGLHFRNVITLLAVLLAYGLVGAMDYAEEQRREAEAALSRAELQQAALLACLNGSAPGLYTTDENGVRNYIVCGTDHWTVNDQNLKQARL